MDVSNILEGLNERSRNAFREGERIRSFASYMKDLTEDTYRFSRGSAQYVRDMFDYYGSEERKSMGEKVTRHLLFDAPFDDGKDQVFGQEVVQSKIYRNLANFAREGTAHRLILLHGPNGSSKTSMVRLIFRGLEHYSRQPEGVLYAISWIFPKKDVSAAKLGFGSKGRISSPRENSAYPSFAYLTGDEIATQIPCEQKDPPFFLLPLKERERLLKAAMERDAYPEESPLHFLEGMLCQKCKSIYENLLNAYQGDWIRVAQHVRVERIFISQRYRTGAVTVEPQMHVDAGIRQLTTDASLSELPASLQTLPLFLTFGDLVDANPGIIEYSDLLKRPIEMNRYLLGTSEKGTVNLECQTVYLNLVMMGTSNEKQLDALKQTPDFTSFRGRLAFVQTPYILEASKEAQIYGPLTKTIGL
ncbi:MAG: serine protein kinase PrkA, partial [Planctomycetota bacterium]|nr:serine protein kinase PrkA [Planctomycetota bacterium]